jgi:hypothetical protein
MIFKYQLVFLGDISNGACNEIRTRFYEKVSEMGLLNDAFVDIYNSNFVTDYQNKQPSFVYYFGKRDHHDKDVDILATLMANGDAIIPVYFHEGDFYEEIPEQAWKMNGKMYTPGKVNTFVNYALEALRLLRQNRKLFISYRRNESTGIANQLFDALVRCNYDVFLDTYSIGAAKNFQEELHHRLSDCDILIQLYTNEFMESPWCREEITAANQKQIGVIELVWPGVALDMHNHLCEPMLLKEDDFTTSSTDPLSRLQDNVVELLSHKVESVRARNMAARQDGLVGEFIKEALKVDKSLVQEYKYLVERKDDGDVNVFIPAVGVPQSYDCYESLQFKELLRNPKTKIHLIYDDLRIKKRWIEHLDWLNVSLEVKTIKKKDFALWLQNN